jgi:3-dehydroquinate synthase
MGSNAERNIITINSSDVPVVVGDNVIERLIETSQKYDRVVLIAGSECFEKFGDHVPDLSGIRGEYTKITLNFDENLKNIRNYQKIIRVMIERNINSDSLIIGLGGPRLCDISGFIAATYRGGLDYIPVPTTPLAQVSNAVSGLNGINFSNFEDAMATRYAPKEIDIDTYFTRSSDNDHLRDAITEILRYGLLSDHSLLTMLHSHDDIKELKESEGLIRLFSKTIQSRVELSENSDPLHRKSLNFGKTIGDMIMHVTKGRAKYSEAVTAGMLVELFLAERSGFSGRNVREKIVSTMDQYGLKKSSVKEVGIDNLLKALNEKYNIENHNLKFVVPEELGKPAVFEMSNDRIMSALRAFTEQYEFSPVV